MDNSLTITSQTESDIGYYACVVTVVQTELEELKFPTVILHTLYPKSIIEKKTTNSELVLGRNITLQCNIKVSVFVANRCRHKSNSVIISTTIYNVRVLVANTKYRD